MTKAICENCEKITTVTFEQREKYSVGVCDTCGKDCVIAHRFSENEKTDISYLLKLKRQIYLYFKKVLDI